MCAPRDTVQRWASAILIQLEEEAGHQEALSQKTDDEFTVFCSAFSQVLRKSAATLKEEWEQALAKIDRDQQRACALRAPVQQEPCGMYGCKNLKIKGHRLCQACQLDFNADPDAFK